MTTSLAPIGLEELVAEAALLTRTDRKYAMDNRDAAALLVALPENTRVLTMEGTRRFAYESVYFDTADLRSFRMAALGRRRRFKLRTRSYLDVRASYLELKTRGAHQTTVKERMAYEFPRRDRLTAAGRSYAAAGLEDLGMDTADADRLAPVLTTRYRRMTLLVPDGGGRATIDTSLSWELADGTSLAVPELVIVETKSGHKAGAVDHLLWSRGIRPVSLSKYGTGLAALRPDLPSHKWARVLRRRFPTPSA